LREKMGLFDDQVAELRGFVREQRESGNLRVMDAPGEAWPLASSLVLQEDMALELGNPGKGSSSILVWTSDGDVEDGRVSLVGPDIGEAPGAGVPLAQAIVVSGDFSNEYDSYRDIRDAVYDTHLEGLSVRAMPSKQIVWCRVSTAAAGAGLSFAHIGTAYIEALGKVPGVLGAEALFVTSSAADVKRLGKAASGAQRLIDAMMKMYTENNFDCESCEYADVCDTVMDLKEIRKKLTDEKA
jgi:CO dehydrogenase/acetyl-CoA synthase beta subunit